MKCTNCGKSIEAENNWVEFECPKCGKETIVRCDKCKKLENSYKCSKCNFVGP
ncbi:MAG: DUF1610 domain-containing protein [Candidatus Aenigmatarchaeota archaeon]|nr:MAG: DUF1610 domain-containing protein [Candidatus Aenigmarchaeota archaeon]